MFFKQALVVLISTIFVQATVPANDNFNDAIPIPAIPAVVQGDNREATDEASGPWWFPAGIWWKWVAPSADRVLILGSATNNGHGLNIVRGDTFGEFENVAFMWINAGLAGFFDPVPGATYHFCVMHGSGPVQFELQPALVNDTAAGAKLLRGRTWSVSQDNSLATTEPGEEISWDKRSLWWKWVAPESGEIRVSTAAGVPQTRALIFKGASPDALQVVEDILSGDRFVQVNEGSTYWFRLTTPPQSVGVVRLHVFQAQPPNDAFANRLIIPNGVVVGTVSGATKEAGEPQLLQNFESNGSVWYTWTATANGKLQVRARNFQSDPLMSWIGLGVFQGTSVGGLVKRAEAQPEYPGPPTPASEIGTTLSVKVGEVYVIGVGGGPADFELILEMIEAPLNDHFGTAALIPLFSGVAADLSGATMELGEPTHASGNAASLWYRWTAPDSGWAVVSAGSPKFYPAIAVYTGNSLTTLARVTNSVLTESGEAFANFYAQSGQTYNIALAGPGGVAAAVAELELRFTTLRITSPTAGQLLAGGKNSVLAINAPNPVVDGSLRSVTYLAAKADGTRANVAVVTNAPYSAIVTNLPVGKVFLFARATNSEGREILSAPVQVRVRPVNDHFADATRVNGYLWEDVAPVGEATREAGEPGHGDASIWWRYEAPGTGRQRINVFAPLGVSGHLLRVYTGTAVGSLSSVPLTSEGLDRFGFNVVSGTVYHIALVVGESHVAADLVFGISGYLSTFSWSKPLGTAFSETTPIPLAITTTENPAEIERVDFYAGATLVGSATGPAFETVWMSYPGFHELFARLIKKSGPQPLELRGLVLKVSPRNDNFAQRTMIVTNQTPLILVTGTASREPGEPSHGAAWEGTVWYSFQPQENGRLLINPKGGIPPQAAIYEGNTLETLRPAGTNVFNPMAPNALNVNLEAQHRYEIAFWGPFDGTFRYYTPPQNDSFAGRRRLRGDTVLVQGHTLLTTREPGEPGPLTNTLWWTWIAPTNGFITLRQVNSSNWLQGAVYIGDSLAGLQPVRTIPHFIYPIDVPVETGKAYTIYLGSYWGEEEYIDFELKFTQAVMEPEFIVVPGSIRRMGRTGGVFTVQGKINRSFRVDMSSDLTSWTELGTFHMGTYELWPVQFPSMNEPGQYFRIVPL